MSSGSDSDSSGDVNNMNNNNMNEFDSSMGIEEQFIYAIEAENFVLLRAILAQKKSSRPAVTDADIRKALYHAASINGVATSRIECCRLLWDALSPRSKKMYFAAKSARSFQFPLHVAVEKGDLEIVRFFIQQLKWNINQTNQHGYKPLSFACNLHFAELEMARFLLENGANINIGGQYGYDLLWSVVNANNTEITRLLLIDYHANPNLNQGPEDNVLIAMAILHGNAEILRMLLECGAFIGHSIEPPKPNGTSLNLLLSNQQKSRETKVAICRILITHATEDQTTAKFLQDTFEFTIKQQTDNIVEYQRILLDSGINTRASMYCAIRAGNLYICQLLVREYQVDPFLQQDDDETDVSDDEQTAASPFLISARLPETTLFEYFLGLWNERFTSSGGKNSDGDYPIHVVCCDRHVSIQAVHLLVNRHPDALAVVDGEQGLLPLHFAANWGASLDVIFFLLQHCPDALCHCRNAVVGVPHRHPSQPATVDVTSMSATTTTTTTTTSETVDSNNDDRRRKKKARTTR